MAKKPEARKPGRPPGSATEPKPTARSFRRPPACPTCKGTDSRVFKTLPPIEHAGIEVVTQERYTRIELRIRQCAACPQKFLEREYVLDGEAKAEIQN